MNELYFFFYSLEIPERLCRNHGFELIILYLPHFDAKVLKLQRVLSHLRDHQKLSNVHLIILIDLVKQSLKNDFQRVVLSGGNWLVGNHSLQQLLVFRNFVFYSLYKLRGD